MKTLHQELTPGDYYSLDYNSRNYNFGGQKCS